MAFKRNKANKWCIPVKHVSVRVMKLKIEPTFKLEKNARLWLECANWLSPIVFKSRELSALKLHKAFYAVVREKGLPSQLTCSLFRTVVATYESALSNNRWKLAVFNKPMLPLVFKRDFSRTKKGIKLWNEVVDVKDSKSLPIPCSWLDSKVQRKGSNWYLLLSYEVPIPAPMIGCAPNPKTHWNYLPVVAGVDLGLKRDFVVTNTGNSNTIFLHGGELAHRRSCIRKTRSEVQAVGTKSSRQLLKRLSGNEASVTEHAMHVASKVLVSYGVVNGVSRFVLEDLVNIRESSLGKGKDLRANVCRWPYANFFEKLAYKSAAVGIEVELIDPKNTSRECNDCHFISPKNRNGLLFSCKNPDKECNHKGDADRCASKNIGFRSEVFGGQRPPKTGALKGCPEIGNAGNSMFMSQEPASKSA